MSIFAFSFFIKALGVGLFKTTPNAPWNSASMASSIDLSPVVILPSTPQNIGLSAAKIKEWDIKGCGVNG